MKIKSCRVIWITIVFFIGMLLGFIWRTSFVTTLDSFVKIGKKSPLPSKIVKAKNGDTCLPHKNIVFLKTHKTGGSTVQNILLRFGQQHNLVVGLPRNSFRFSYLKGIKFHQDLVYPSEKSINMLCHHMRFDKQQISSLMPSDTKYITILREPGSLFVSYFDYFYESCSPFHFVPHTTDGLKQFLDKAQNYLNASPGQLYWFAKNGMFHDLGFEFSQDDDDYIKRAIDEMDSTYHLVLISDYFEESIVLMKELLCLSFSDIQHLRLNSRLHDEIKTDEETRDRIRKWNKADSTIYRHYNETFWRKVEEYGRERMQRDVEELKRFNTQLQSKCIAGGRVSSSLVDEKEHRVYNPKGVEMAGFVLKESVRDNKFCQSIVQTERTWYKHLMKKQHNVDVD